MTIVSKECVLYISGVKRRTELIWRAFEAKNGITRAQVADIFAHFLVAYGTDKVFGGMLREFNPRYEAFDRAIREHMEKNTPEEYRRFPLLQRLFGRLYKPLVKSDLDKIDAIIAAETAEEIAIKEAPEVDSKDIE